MWGGGGGGSDRGGMKFSKACKVGLLLGIKVNRPERSSFINRGWSFDTYRAKSYRM